MGTSELGFVTVDAISPEERGLDYPLIGHAQPDSILAWRAGQSISAGQFLSDTLALARRLPARRHVLNLLGDRYRFAVGLAAALCREQISLLPPNDTPATLAALAADYPDLYCLADGAAPAIPVPCVEFRDGCPGHEEPYVVPRLPGMQRALLLFTSGSTGRPKPAPKSWGALARSARAAGTRLGVGALSGAAVAGTVPHQHSYGLESTVLLPLQHGLALQAERPFYAGDILACLESVPRPRILVTSPIHIRALLGESGTLPAVDLVLSATAPLSPALAAEAEARFRAPVVEIYGCSEAGQLATRRTVAEAGWHSLDGVQLRQDGHGTWAAGAAVETETLLHDVIDIDASGRFRLLGRTADLVNVAGKRTSLAHLDQQLLSIAGVSDGAFLMPDEAGEGVTRLIAFAVAPGVAPETILAALRRRVDAAFLPRPLLLVDSLPRNSMGKLPRAALLQLARRAAG